MEFRTHVRSLGLSARRTDLACGITPISMVPQWISFPVRARAGCSSHVHVSSLSHSFASNHVQDSLRMRPPRLYPLYPPVRMLAVTQPRVLLHLVGLVELVWCPSSAWLSRSSMHANSYALLRMIDVGDEVGLAHYSAQALRLESRPAPFCGTLLTVCCTRINLNLTRTWL